MIENPLISQKEYDALHDCAKEVKSGCIVEIGNYCGASTLALAWGANDGVMIYSIDPHLPFCDPIEGDKKGIKFGPHDKKSLYYLFITENMQASQWYNEFPFNRVSLIEINSNWVDPSHFGPIGMVFIDGDHSLEQATKDYINYGRKVMPGGLVLFHDRSWAGPAQVIKDAVKDGEIVPVKTVDNLAIFWRT